MSPLQESPYRLLVEGQEEPGLPFGTALKAGSFETDREGALQFVAWFRNLFVET